MCSAAASTAPSAPRGPVICRETGRPSSPRPMGIAQAGRPARLASNRKAPQSGTVGGAASAPSKASQPTVGVSSRPERSNSSRVGAVDALALDLRADVDVGGDRVAGGQERVARTGPAARALLERLGVRPARLGGGDRRPRRGAVRQSGRVVRRAAAARRTRAERRAHVVVERRRARRRPRSAERRRDRLEVDVAASGGRSGSRPARHSNISRASATDARQRAVGDERLPALRARLARHGAERRLEADDAAERGRDADRAAAVAAERQRARAGGDRDRGAAGGAARRPRRVVRVVRCRASCPRNRTPASRSWRRSPRRRPRAGARRRRSRSGM